jgi:hypothetical protein
VQDRLDLRIALGNLDLVEIVELQRLAEGEDVFGAVVPREGLADGLSEAAHRTSRNSASVSGAWIPETMARMIRIPVTPVMSETT